MRANSIFKWSMSVLRLGAALLVLYFAVHPAAANSLASGQIAFASNRTGKMQIFTMNADGSNQVNISNNGFDEEQPAWSPDNSKIAFVSDRDGNGEICW